MNYKVLLLLAVITISIFHFAEAGAGDTTYIQAHQGKHLEFYNNYDTTIQFPDGNKKYNRIL